MRIVVPLKAVPDLVEEIELTADGTDIDREYLKFVLQRMGRPGAGGGAAGQGRRRRARSSRSGLADDPDIDQALYTAIAKGADSAVKVERRDRPPTPTRRAAASGGRTCGAALPTWCSPASRRPTTWTASCPRRSPRTLGWPHVSVVVSVEAAERHRAVVRQEFAGGRAPTSR